MNTQEQIIADLAAQRAGRSTVILCLFTGARLPAACEPMVRFPVPRTDILFDGRFPQELAQAIAQNPAVEDGAIMVGRVSAAVPYRVVGWSFRLFPPSTLVKAPANRGSAFNSCLAMSTVSTVDRVYLVSGSGVFAFYYGEVTEPFLAANQRPFGPSES
jgi:hypothetical protein